MKYRFIKTMLARLGERASARVIHNVSGLFNYLHAGWWMKANGFRAFPRFSTREDLYAHLAGQTEQPIEFLEFGVYRGESITAWARLMAHPETRLFGFDSFAGLPERWRMAADRSTFDVGGAIPKVDDARVRFCKGWFTDSLPPFLNTFASSRPLILHLDADLYNSTLYVLNALRSHLRAGTVLIFDEFFDRDHELKAFDEFKQETGMSFECLGATSALVQVAFRITNTAPD